jgi:hypothetical protein
MEDLMIRRSMLAMPFALGLVGSTTDAQEAPTPTPPSSPGRAYKVAFWYELARPWSTAKYRAYDLAKGDYDQTAVDRWQRTIFEKYPNMGATVRDLSTVGEPGATEAERLASAVEREKKRWADLNKGPSMPRPSMVPSNPAPRTRDKGVSRASFDFPSPGSSGTPMYPSPSPFPYPYRSGPR